MLGLQGISYAYRYQRQNWQEQNLAVSRLASGLRIQSAADDPAGFAVSTKLQVKIRGSEQAKRNVIDGTSLVQTADAYLQTMQDQLQRLRDLLVQAQNGTLSEQEKQLIQQEMNVLIQSLGNISQQAKFNGISLLNSWISGTPGTPGTPASQQQTPKQISVQYTFTILGQTFDKPITNFTIPSRTADGVLTIEATYSNPQKFTPDLFVVSPNQEQFGEGRTYLNSQNYIENNTNSSSTNATYNGAKNVTESMTFYSPIAGPWQILINNPKKAEHDVTLTISYHYTEITDIPAIPGIPGTPGHNGTVAIQAGDTRSDLLQIELSSVSPDDLGIAGLQAVDPQGVAKIDQALEKISSERTKYGSFQNILQFRYQFLDQLTVNLQAADSRIEDADMAQEAIRYVRAKLLQEASTQLISNQLEYARKRIALLLAVDNKQVPPPSNLSAAPAISAPVLAVGSVPEKDKSMLI